MVNPFALVSALVVMIILSVSGLEHLRTLGDFRQVISGQGVFPSAWSAPIAWATSAAEVSLGAVGLVGLLGAVPGAIKVSLLGAASLFLIYSLYLAHVARLGHLTSNSLGVPCGCGWPDAQRIDRLTITRAAFLAVLSIIGVTEPWAMTMVPAATFSVSLLQAGSLALLVWIVPPALQPSDTGHRGREG